jgi:sigma-B regulation protein RsbU (phosphoserine phosphatase)
VLRVALALVFATATVVYAVAWVYYAHQRPTAFLGIVAEYHAMRQEYLIERVVPNTSAAAAGLRAGDAIVAVDGYPLETLNPFHDRVQRGHPGDVAVITVRRHGQLLPPVRTTLGAAPRDTSSLANRLMLTPLHIYPLPFLLVGLTVLALRLRDRHAWLLAAAFAGLGTGPHSVFEPLAHPALRGYLLAYTVLMSGLMAPLFYALLACFPAPSPIDRRVPWLKTAVVAAAALLFVPQAAWTWYAGSVWPMVRGWSVLFSRTGDLAMSLSAFAVAALGLVSLLLNARSTADPGARRKARLLVASFVACVVPWLCLAAAALARGMNPMQFPLWAWAPSALLLMLSPVVFGYTVVKHRVLELSVLVRRSVRYVIVQRGFVLVAVLASIVTTLAFAMVIARVLPYYTEAGLPAGVAIGAAFGLVLVRTGGAFARTVTRRIDRAFFRDAYDARRILEDLARDAAEATSREELVARLERELDVALHPTHLDTWLREPDGARLRRASSRAAPSASAIDADLVAAWCRSRQGARVFTPEDAAAFPVLAALEPDSLVPLWSRGHQVLGLVVLGSRMSDEPYSREDLGLLSSVASQAAAAVENLALAEEIARRLERERVAAREFEIAADVQRRLLPARAVALETVEYTGRCVQARAVGGDYYDFLDLGNGVLGLVLADISGKGLYAALLMANLQASLRSLSARLATGDPVQVLAEVNHSFSESTALNHFATLFVGIYDDRRRRLRYVNCGHQPPFVLRASGAVERLDVTAGAIGFLEEWQAEAVETALAPGDALVLFTDGVTEAMNDAGEEFGEARLLAVLRDHRELSLPELMDAVLGAVRAFGGREQSDDLTLVLVRSRAGVPEPVTEPLTEPVTA